MEIEHTGQGAFANDLISELAVDMAKIASSVEEFCGASREGYRVGVLEEVPLDEGYQLNFCVSRADGEPGRFVFPVSFRGDEVFSLPRLESALTVALNTACGIGIFD